MARIRPRTIWQATDWLALPLGVIGVLLLAWGLRSAHFTFLALRDRADGADIAVPDDNGFATTGVAAGVITLGVLFRSGKRNRPQPEPRTWPPTESLTWIRTDVVPLVAVFGLLFAMLAMRAVYGWPRGVPPELETERTSPAAPRWLFVVEPADSYGMAWNAARIALLGALAASVVLVRRENQFAVAGFALRLGCLPIPVLMAIGGVSCFVGEPPKIVVGVIWLGLGIVTGIMMFAWLYDGLRYGRSN